MGGQMGNGDGIARSSAPVAEPHGEQDGADDTAETSEAEEPLMRLPPEGLSLRELERQLLIQALERTGGNQTRAAALLGLNRDQIRYRIEKFGLRAKLS